MASQVYGIVSEVNTNLNLNQVAWNLASGTVVSSSRTVETSSIILDTGSSVDDEYNGLLLEITGGTGLNNYYLIADYVGSTKTCTINKYIEVLPDSTSLYIVHTYSGMCGNQDQDDQYKSVTLKPDLPEFDSLFSQCFIKFINGHNQLKKIVSYDSTTKIVKIDSELEETLYDSSLFLIIGESGVARTSVSNGSTTIYLQETHGHNSTDTDFYVGFYVEIYSGTGSGQTRKISGYDETTLICTLDNAWVTELSTDSYYNIYSGWGAETYDSVLKYTQTTVGVLGGPLEKNVIYQQLSFSDDNFKNVGKYSENSNVSPNSAHTLVVVSNFFKMKIVSLGTTLIGGINTLFHNSKSKKLTSFIEEGINKNNDCELTRSIIAGKTTTGVYKNAILNNSGVLMTEIAKPLSSFGEVNITELEPVVQISFPYYKNEDLIVEKSNYATRISTVTPGDVGVANIQNMYTPAGISFTSSGSADYFYIFSTTTTYYVWFNLTDGSTTDPSATGTGVQVDILTTDLSYEVAGKLVTTLDGEGAFTVVLDTTGLISNSNLVNITNSVSGVVTTIQRGTMPIDSSSLVDYVENESSLSITNEVGIGTMSTLMSKRIHNYRPGQGGVARFSCIFEESTIGIQQIAGLGNQVSGFFFGTDPSTGIFGILHRSSGIPSVYKLQITAESTESQVLTIKLDDVDYQVSLVSGTVSEVTYQIVLLDDIFKLGGWIVDQVNDTLIFTSEIVEGPRSGTYSVTSSTADVEGTFTTISIGESIVNTWIDKFNWNINKLNGYESNNMHLNITKGNNYEIQYQAGYGNVIFSIADKNNNSFIPVHSIKHENDFITPNIIQPSMRLIWMINTTTSTNSSTMKMNSGSIFNEGKIKNFDNLFSKSQSLALTSTAEEHIITYKNLRSFKGKINNITLKPYVINFTNDATKTSVIRIYSNSTLTNYNYNYIRENLSSIVYDTVATVSGGTLLYSVAVSKSFTNEISENLLNALSLLPNDSLTFTVQSSTSNAIDITSVLTWHEDH